MHIKNAMCVTYSNNFGLSVKFRYIVYISERSLSRNMPGRLHAVISLPIPMHNGHI